MIPYRSPYRISYVDTYMRADTHPEWAPLAGEGRVVSTRSDSMRDVVGNTLLYAPPTVG